jgi:hypothetical protein
MRYNSQSCRRGHIINTMEYKYYDIISLTIDMQECYVMLQWHHLVE